MEYDLIFKNGTVVTASATFQADVAIQGKTIAAVGLGLTGDGEIIDCLGKYVLPGAIDAHTHLAMPFGGTISSDDYEAGTRSAACGGTTTVFDFIQQNPGETFPEAFHRRYDMAARQATVDFAFHMGISDASGGLLDTMKDVVAMGISSFKVFMVYDFRVTDGIFYEALSRSKDIGALIAVHAENNEMVQTLIARHVAENKRSPWYHYMSRPEFVEGEADIRAIQWATSLNAPLYIVHLANAQGMEAVRAARAQGHPIYAETCPQYLHFTNQVYKRPDGQNFVCSPSIKGRDSQKALWAGILSGDISVVATDHCPFTQEEKNWGQEDFTKIPNGCAGIETMYPYMLSEANRGRITFNKVVELCATNPAKIFGISRRKGAIQPGLDADLVVYDPKARVTVTNEMMHGDTDHTIWEGLALKGYPEAVWSRGRLVCREGIFLGERGAGRILYCDPVRLNGPQLVNQKDDCVTD